MPAGLLAPPKNYLKYVRLDRFKKPKHIKDWSLANWWASREQRYDWDNKVDINRTWIPRLLSLFILSLKLIKVGLQYTLYTLTSVLTFLSRLCSYSLIKIFQVTWLWCSVLRFKSLLFSKNHILFWMPGMYFSGEDAENITLDDPVHRCIIVNPNLSAAVQLDKERNARVSLDPRLLRIRSYTPENDLLIKRDARIVDK